MGEFVNSKQARFDRSHVSCGVMEVHHLPNNTAAKTVFAIATALYHKANPRPSAFLMFSDVVDDGSTGSRGQQLAAQFTGGKFGKLIQTSGLVNPRSGNTIRVWILEIDHDSFRKYYQEELANRVEE